MTAADIARAAFDELLSFFAARYRSASKPLHAGEVLANLERDFEQVLIRLQFVGMEATCLQLDLDKLRQEREERDAHEAGLRIGGFGTDDHLDVTVIDPDDLDE